MGSTLVRLRSVGDIRKFFAPFTDDCPITHIDASYYFDNSESGAVKLECAANTKEQNGHIRPTRAMDAIAILQERFGGDYEKFSDFDNISLVVDTLAKLQLHQ